MKQIVSLEALGPNAARLISVEAGRLGDADEKLAVTRRHFQRISETITLLAEQLHYLAKMGTYVNGKTLQIVSEFHKIQGSLTAKKVNLHTAYKHLKIQDRTTNDKQLQKVTEQEMRQLGETIRQIDALIQGIQVTEKNLVSDIKQDISTLRYIAQRAE